MTVLALVLRKIRGNPILSLLLASGLVLASALIAAIPLYTSGVLQGYLRGELEETQTATGSLPGTYHVAREFTPFAPGNGNTALYEASSRLVEERLASRVPLPVLAQSRRITLSFLAAEPESRPEDGPLSRNPRLVGMDSLLDHVKILRGRPYARESVDGVYEAVATEEALRELDLRLEDVVLIRDTAERVPGETRVRIVGTFAPTGTGDPYWFPPWAGAATVLQSPNANCLFIDSALLENDLLLGKGYGFVTAEWYTAFDHRKVSVPELGRILGVLRAAKRFAQEEGFDLEIPMLPILERYKTRERELRVTLAVLESPVLLMLIFYLSMVSRLLVESEKNDIAVLKSRGGSSRQVFVMYAVESLLFGVIAAILGPPLGLLACRLVGASGGFMEFVNRSSLPVVLVPDSFAVAALGLTLFTAAVMVPAIRGSRTTIVLHKQAVGRKRGELLWRRSYLDLILLAVAAYGYWSAHEKRRILVLTGARGTDLPVDPLYFLISVLFLLGAGLLFVRLLPFLLRAVFWIGRRFWPPELYASFINIARSVSQGQYVVIFLILTVGVGVLSSGTARSLDRAVEDRIRYGVGADVNLTPYWWTEHAASAVVNPDAVFGSGSAISRLEPSFEAYASLPGVAAATKVLRKSPVKAWSAEGAEMHVTLLAIDPASWGGVAWGRPDLYPGGLVSCLRALAYRPDAILVSRSVSEQYGVEPGDRVAITLGSGSQMVGRVAGIVEYWPTYNPYLRDESDEPAHLILASLPYVESRIPPEPYEIWIRRDPAAPGRALYDALSDRGLRVVRFRDADQEVASAKANPFRQGMNGVLTLGFLVSLAVCLSGYLISWYVSIRSRALQFGVFRAMGLSRLRLIAMLAWEQLLVSGLAVAAGVFLGGAATALFVPLLGVLTDAAEQVPVMQVGVLLRDYWTIGLFSVGMVVLAMVLLGSNLSRLRMAQAIKLGEE